MVAFRSREIFQEHIDTNFSPSDQLPTLNILHAFIMDICEHELKVDLLSRVAGIKNPAWTTTWFTYGNEMRRLAGYDLKDKRNTKLLPKAVTRDLTFEELEWILRLVNAIEGNDGGSLTALSRALEIPSISIVQEHHEYENREQTTSNVSYTLEPHLHIYFLRDDQYIQSNLNKLVRYLGAYDTKRFGGIIVNQDIENSVIEFITPLQNWMKNNSTYENVGIAPTLFNIPLFYDQNDPQDLKELAGVQQGFNTSTIFPTNKKIAEVLAWAKTARSVLKSNLVQKYADQSDKINKVLYGKTSSNKKKESEPPKN